MLVYSFLFVAAILYLLSVYEYIKGRHCIHGSCDHPGRWEKFRSTIWIATMVIAFCGEGRCKVEGRRWAIWRISCYQVSNDALKPDDLQTAYRKFFVSSSERYIWSSSHFYWFLFDKAKRKAARFYWTWDGAWGALDVLRSLYVRAIIKLAWIEYSTSFS